MIKNLFFDVYKWSGGTLTYLLLIFAFIVSLIILYIIIRGIMKSRINPVQIAAVIILGILLCIPSISAGINLYGFMTRNEKAQQLSIAVTPISWQKGVYYLQLGNSKAGKNAVEYYEKAYKHIGSYKYKCWAAIPLVNYYFVKDYDTALEIAELNNEYATAANCYIMKDDYKNALISINNAIDKNPKNALLYAKRGFICNKLGQKELAEVDLKMALQLSNKKEQILQTYNDWKNYELKRLTEKRKEAGID